MKNEREWLLREILRLSEKLASLVSSPMANVVSLDRVRDAKGLRTKPLRQGDSIRSATGERS